MLVTKYHCWPAPAFSETFVWYWTEQINLTWSKREQSELSSGRLGVDGRVGSGSVEKREERISRGTGGREGSGLWWWTGNLQGHEFFSRLHPQGYKDSYRCKEAGCCRHLFSTGTRVSMPPPSVPCWTSILHPLSSVSSPSRPLSVLLPEARLKDCQQMQKRDRGTENERETVFFFFNMVSHLAPAGLQHQR